MTSAERVIEYVDLEPEEPPVLMDSLVLPPQWPTGAIVFDDLSFRYSPTAPWALDKINLSIRAREKVTGRCARVVPSLLSMLLLRSASLDGQVPAKAP